MYQPPRKKYPCWAPTVGKFILHPTIAPETSAQDVEKKESGTKNSAFS